MLILVFLFLLGLIAVMVLYLVWAVSRLYRTHKDTPLFKWLNEDEEEE